MAPLLVMWSLAIEEQFYLVWPVVIRYLKREHIMWLCLFMIVMAPLSRIVMVLTGWETWQVYMYTWCRVDAIALGALVALLIEKQDHPYLRPMARWMLASGLIGLAVVMLVTGGLLWDTPLMQTLGYSAFAALAGAFLVYGLVLPETHWWNRFLSWRLLTTYGMLCYGLYLTHYLPAKHLIVSPIPYVAMLAIGLPLTFVIGWGAYVLVERPFLRLKDRLAAGELRPDAIAAVPAGPAAPGAAAAPPGSDYQPQ
jgi:peptidoglycan/LPS O-acetylase OafA/YrhL